MTRENISNTSAPPIKVAVIAFDRISPFHLWVPTTVFGTTYETGGHYQVSVCAEKEGELTTSDDLTLTIPHDLSLIDAFGDRDMIIIPSWREIEKAPSEHFLRVLNSAHQRGVTIVGLCLGAFPLAEAGLLDNRRATTHWASADDFAKRFPKVHLDADMLYADEGQIVTSAGVAAGIDCCLHIMRRQIGAKAANHTARNLVVSPHREGGQAQFIERPVEHKSGEGRFDHLLSWVRDNLDQPHSLDEAAAKVNMSRRSFTRKFHDHMGTSFAQWLLAERLGLSQAMLEATDLSIDAIAFDCGFGSTVSYRHHFRRKFGVTPTTWRKTFQGHAGAEAKTQTARIDP